MAAAGAPAVPGLAAAAAAAVLVAAVVVGSWAMVLAGLARWWCAMAGYVFNRASAGYDFKVWSAAYGRGSAAGYVFSDAASQFKVSSAASAGAASDCKVFSAAGYVFSSGRESDAAEEAAPTSS